MAITSFAVGLGLASLVSFVFAGLAWHKRDELGAVPLVVFHLAVGVGNGGYALDIVTVDPAVQLFWATVWLVGQAFTATTWLYVAIEYTGKTRWATRRTAALVGLEPVLFAVAITVPGLRELFFEVTGPGGQGSIVYTSIDQGLLWFVHFGYLFVTMIAGTFLFVQLFVRATHFRRVQAGAVAIAAVAPWTTVLAQSLGFAPSSDPSAIAWAVAGGALTVGLYQFETLDPVPMANEAIVEDMGDGVLVLDSDGVVGHCNPAATRLLGLAESDLVGSHVGDAFPGWTALDTAPEAAADADTTALGAAETDVTADLDPGAWTESTVEVDGETRYLEAQASAFHDYRGNFVGQLVVLRDVTERKRREQNLARYKTVFETVQDRVYVLDSDGRFLMVNEPLAAMLGYDRTELVGRPFESILSEPATTDLAEADATAERVEVTVETADGESVPCETRRAPVEFDGLQGTVGYVRDISRRRQAERDLAETAGRLETLVDASPLAVIATDGKGRVESWNPAAEETFGYEPDEVVGDVAPIIPEDQREFVTSRIERTLSGERFTGIEVPLERKDGAVVETSVSLAPLHDASGDVYGTVAILADITERKERERELQQKNERLEEFASVVSHDLRNPLQVARSYLELVREGETEHVDDVDDALDRMEDIVEDVLALARQGNAVIDSEPVSVAAVAETAWENVATGDAQLTVADGLGVVEGDRSRLLELFENLFRNAVEHGSTSPRQAGDAVERAGPAVSLRVEPTPDGFAVEDDGPGIPPEKRDDVFEAGFTTAPDGTGFGLAIVKTIAEAHGWEVTVTDSSRELSVGDEPTADGLGGARFVFRTETVRTRS